MKLFEDRVSGSGPAKGLGVRVVVVDELIDALHELLDAGERTTADGLVSDQREKPFDLIQPLARPSPARPRFPFKHKRPAPRHRPRP